MAGHFPLPNSSPSTPLMRTERKLRRTMQVMSDPLEGYYVDKNFTENLKVAIRAQLSETNIDALIKSVEQNTLMDDELYPRLSRKSTLASLTSPKTPGDAQVKNKSFIPVRTNRHSSRATEDQNLRNFTEGDRCKVTKTDLEDTKKVVKGEQLMKSSTYHLRKSRTYQLNASPAAASLRTSHSYTIERKTKNKDSNEAAIKKIRLVTNRIMHITPIKMEQQKAQIDSANKSLSNCNLKETQVENNRKQNKHLESAADVVSSAHFATVFDKCKTEDDLVTLKQCLYHNRTQRLQKQNERGDRKHFKFVFDTGDNISNKGSNPKLFISKKGSLPLIDPGLAYEKLFASRKGSHMKFVFDTSDVSNKGSNQKLFISKKKSLPLVDPSFAYEKLFASKEGSHFKFVFDTGDNVSNKGSNPKLFVSKKKSLPMVDPSLAYEKLFASKKGSHLKFVTGDTVSNTGSNQKPLVSKRGSLPVVDRSLTYELLNKKLSRSTSRVNQKTIVTEVNVTKNKRLIKLYEDANSGESLEMTPSELLELQNRRLKEMLKSQRRSRVYRNIFAFVQVVLRLCCVVFFILKWFSCKIVFISKFKRGKIREK